MDDGIDYSRGPQKTCEQIVFKHILDCMGEQREKTAWVEYLRLSDEFTITENVLNYDGETFYKARAKYIMYKFEEERKMWLPT